MKLDWKRCLMYSTGAMICGLCGYISGHASCAHQHVTSKEQNKMLLDENGRISIKKYIKGMFEDFYKTMKDPLGLEVELD